MSLLQLLPLAFVMIAGPQIITSFFLSTSRRWAATSAAYVAGASVATTVLVTIAYFVGGGNGKRATHPILDWVVLALLVVAIVHTYLTRAESQPPRWMSSLQQEQPGPAFLLGFLLFVVGPADIVTAFAVGFHMANHQDPWWHCLPFIALTALFLGLPAIGVLLMGHRAETVLPRVRDWMSDNSWIVSEVVLLLFVVITINSLA